MSEYQLGNTLRILLVEDNPGDIMLTREALKRSRFETNLSVAVDGEDGMAFLKRHGSYSDAVLPDLILLDLNMPRKDGHTFLAELKNDPALGYIPVIIFSTSESQRDILKSYKLGANCYVPKPYDFNKFHETVGMIIQFWRTAARLPGPDPVLA